MASTELMSYEQVEDVLVNGADLDIVPAEELQGDIARRILDSATLEEAFADYQTVKATEIEGLTVTVHGVAWAKSAFEEGPAAYALLDITREKSDFHEVVSMGGRSLMASFLWAQRNQKMPFKGVFMRKQSQTNPERKFWTFKLA